MKAQRVWTPQPGSQTRFLTCPVFECLYEGSRGQGKTDALLMDFAQHVGQGLGSSWRGVLFRHSYKQLEDVIAKSRKWFYRIFEGVRYHASQYKWIWPDGEELLLRQINRIDDYWKYHGHEYPWIGFEELTNWPTSDCYLSMMSCCRSSDPKVPKKIRATCNPWGPGHNWVKARFVDPAPPGVVVMDSLGGERVRVHGRLSENRIFLKAQPQYKRQLEALDDPNKKKAWLEGSWDIAAGGALDDLWEPQIHLIEPFTIPKSWRVDRSFDWGSSRPFSVGWWAESDGTEARMKDGASRYFPKGSLIRIAERYGWNGNPDQGCRMLAADVAREINEIEKKLGYKVHPGPADNQIFNFDNGHSIADEMARVGVRWERSDKSPGSRKTGLEKLRAYLKAALDVNAEEPGLFIFNTCRHFIRTVPVLTRSGIDPDDIDQKAEDHIYDEVRYRLMYQKPIIQQRKLTGF